MEWKRTIRIIMQTEGEQKDSLTTSVLRGSVTRYLRRSDTPMRSFGRMRKLLSTAPVAKCPVNHNESQSTRVRDSLQVQHGVPC